jgi:23S rRNA pseudouridine2457 synthase
MSPCLLIQGRPTLADYIHTRLFAAGRLDRVAGLMILTSDGALTHRVTDPKHKCPKSIGLGKRIPDDAALDACAMGSS